MTVSEVCNDYIKRRMRLEDEIEALENNPFVGGDSIDKYQRKLKIQSQIKKEEDNILDILLDNREEIYEGWKRGETVSDPVYRAWQNFAYAQGIEVSGMPEQTRKKSWKEIKDIIDALGTTSVPPAKEAKTPEEILYGTI